MEIPQINPIDSPLVLALELLSARKEIPTRKLRLRRVAHQYSRAYGMALIVRNAQKVRDYWANLLRTNEEEYFLLHDAGNNEEEDWDKQRRIQKSKGYRCYSCV